MKGSAEQYSIPVVKLLIGPGKNKLFWESVQLPLPKNLPQKLFYYFFLLKYGSVQLKSHIGPRSHLELSCKFKRNCNVLI